MTEQGRSQSKKLIKRPNKSIMLRKATHAFILTCFFYFLVWSLPLFCDWSVVYLFSVKSLIKFDIFYTSCLSLLFVHVHVSF